MVHAAFDSSAVGFFRYYYGNQEISLMGLVAIIFLIILLGPLVASILLLVMVPAIFWIVNSWLSILYGCIAMIFEPFSERLSDKFNDKSNKCLDRIQ